MQYQSELTIDSKALEGVSFTISRMSFGRRIELVKRVRALIQRLEFFQAGTDAIEKIEATLLAAEIDQLYLDWGLIRVNGLDLDGEPATKDAILAAGPEDFSNEILTALKAECGLTPEERKN
jgi:hypothetical protein